VTISSAHFEEIVGRLRAAGFADDDIAWSEGCGAPKDADDFASEAIFVICNSGMKNTVARRIYDKVMPMVKAGGSALNVFGHYGKSQAIDVIWIRRGEFFAGFMAAEDKVAYCETLPWIGPITKCHLAKNFGVDVAKPDVHLQRLADLEGATAQELCERLRGGSPYRYARTVDVLLWRACAEGIIDSRTGAFAAPEGELSGKPADKGGEE
jgi:hypothetical protein